MLTPIDRTVHVATLAEDRVKACFATLLQLIFFNERDDEAQRFFSISLSARGSAESISIIADATDLAAFEPGDISVDDTLWEVLCTHVPCHMPYHAHTVHLPCTHLGHHRPLAAYAQVLLVGEGSVGFESVGVVERITGPLASAAIPVLYISTVSTDYVLIPVDRVAAAHAVLERCVGGEVARVAPPSPPRERHAHSHPLLALSAARTCIFCVDKAALREHTSALLRLLFLPQPNDPPLALRALTETPDEISVLTGTPPWFVEYAERSALRGSHQTWVPIRVGEDGGTPLDEVGVVATQAYVLASANLPILYHATFLSDYTLVQEEQLDTAIAAFAAADFSITKSREEGQT